MEFPMYVSDFINNMPVYENLDYASKAMVFSNAALLITSPCILGFKNAVLASLVVDAAISWFEYDSSENHQLPNAVVDLKDFALEHLHLSHNSTQASEI